MKEAMLVPIRCQDCGETLTYMDINDEDSQPTSGVIRCKIRCKKCGDGVRFYINKVPGLCDTGKAHPVRKRSE